MKDKTGFSKRLNKLMAQKKMTVKQAAAIAGTGTSKIQAWRSGSLSTDYEALGRLSEAFDVSLEYLLTGRNKTLPGVSEVFKNGDQLFDGYLKVKIERMIPRNFKEAKEGDDE